MSKQGDFSEISTTLRLFQIDELYLHIKDY